LSLVVPASGDVRFSAKPQQQQPYQPHSEIENEIRGNTNARNNEELRELEWNGKNALLEWKKAAFGR